MNYAPIEDILQDVARGVPVVVVDSADRENEADLVVAAERVTEESVNFMIQHGRGLLCLSLMPSRLAQLRLTQQVVENTAPLGTRFTASIDHHSVVGRGVTAKGRTETIRQAIDERSNADDFVVPGYVFPLAAREGGVLCRGGHTEASVDLARLSDLKPAGVICEIMDSSGLMVRGQSLLQYCSEHELKMTSIEAISKYRLRFDVCLRRVATCELHDLSGLGIAQDQLTEPLQVISFIDDADGKEHLAFIRGTPKNGALVRIHSECLTGDVFGSLRCDCGEQLRRSLLMIIKRGEGIVVYLHQEGRGIGLANKLRAYELQDLGRDTVQANIELGFEADYRDYRAGAHILRDLGLAEVSLLTNNPKKVEGLEQFGIKVRERVALPVSCHPGNEGYLRTKRDRLGHLLSF